MVVVILGMLVCLLLAVIVLALVALPARRQGEVMFINRGTDEGETQSDIDADADDRTVTDATDTTAAARDREHANA